MNILCWLFKHKIINKHTTHHKPSGDVIFTHYICKRCGYNQGAEINLQQVTDVKNQTTKVSWTGGGGGGGIHPDKKITSDNPLSGNATNWRRRR